MMLKDPTRYILTAELNFENIPPASSHSDPVTTANLVYDFAPNLKEDIVLSANSAYQFIEHNPGVIGDDSSECDYI